jgi:hypothetical protein
MPATTGHVATDGGPVGGKEDAVTVDGRTLTGSVVVGAMVEGAAVDGGVVGGTVQFWPHESTGPAMWPSLSPARVCTAFMSN